MKDEFSRFNPLVNLLYFIFTIGIAMFVMHPLFICVSLIAGISYSIYLNGFKAVKFNFLILLPMVILGMIINAAFNHEGVTILGYFPGGNPLTLESLEFSLAAGGMMMSVICLFTCMTSVLLSDKLMYLFGRLAPILALIFSIALRFSPLFADRFKKTLSANMNVSKAKKSSFTSKFKNAAITVSMMISWALKNAVDTADSMKGRGFGTTARSSYAKYKIDTRDICAIVCLTALFVSVCLLIFRGACEVYYFPLFYINSINTVESASILMYSLLCFAPIIINFTAGILWKYFRSKI